MAQAIIKAAGERNLNRPEAQNFQAESGKGARAVVNGETIGISRRLPGRHGAGFAQRFASFNLSKLIATLHFFIYSVVGLFSWSRVLISPEAQFATGRRASG